MRIRCWGTRGSIPVSGIEYLKYGGDTTCIEIRSSNDEVIIVDAGSGIRKLGHCLLQEKKRSYHLLFTHAHLDHVLGLPFFKPIYRSNSTIDIYACPFEHESIEKMLSKIVSPPTSPVDFRYVKADIVYRQICGESFAIDTVTVSSIFLSHPNRGLGYKFEENGRSFVFITDNELGYRHPGGQSYEDYVAFAAKADLLYHDAEFTAEEYKVTRTWGHSRYMDALQLALDAGVQQLGLFHHNQERSDEAVDSIVDSCQSEIRRRSSGLTCFGVYAGLEHEL